jgi:hypothetical protein
VTCVTAEPLASATTDPSDVATAHCQACESSRRRVTSGAYNFRCVHCCARLVLSAHPNKKQASVMLAAIARFRDAPGRDEVLACVALELTKRRSALAKSSTDK